MSAGAKDVHEVCVRLTADGWFPARMMICSPLGPQSGLLGLLLAAKFFHDPLVCLPAGLSTIFMTLACAPPAATRVASACPPYVFIHS